MHPITSSICVGRSHLYPKPKVQCLHFHFFSIFSTHTVINFEFGWLQWDLVLNGNFLHLSATAIIVQAMLPGAIAEQNLRTDPLSGNDSNTAFARGQIICIVSFGTKSQTHSQCNCAVRSCKQHFLQKSKHFERFFLARKIKLTGENVQNKYKLSAVFCAFWKHAIN